LYDMNDGGGQDVADLSTTDPLLKNSGTLGSARTADSNDPLWLATSQINCSVQGNFRETSAAIENSYSPDSTGVDNELNSAVRIFPNPSAGAFNIEVKTTSETFALKIVDATGHEINHFGFLKSNVVHAIQNTLPQGMYIFIVEDKGKRSVHKAMRTN